VGQSYGAVVEAMGNKLADVAFMGPVSYVQAHQRGCAQLLAVSVERGASVYYAGPCLHHPGRHIHHRVPARSAGGAHAFPFSLKKRSPALKKQSLKKQSKRAVCQTGSDSRQPIKALKHINSAAA